MQLATSQRPHPPPVPPRPSRQVVAEALKRSPRPPCPTRQAPPPPNTRPWRSEEKENVKPPKGGRTIIYESVREPQTNGENRSCSPGDQSQRAPDPPRCSSDETVAPSGSGRIAGAVAEKTVERGVGGSTRGTSERNEAENQRERQQHRRPQPRSNGSERCDRENSTAHPSEPKSTDRRSAISYDNFATNEKSLEAVGSANEVARTSYDLEGNSAEEADRVRAKSKSPMGRKTPTIGEHTATGTSWGIDDDPWNFDRECKTPLDGCANEKFAKSSAKDGAEIRNDDAARTERRSSSSFGEKSERRQGEVATTGMRLSTTPTRLEEISNNNGKVVGARDENEEPISRGREDEAEEIATMSGSTTTISSDDCATVVVIDEPERKIAFSEDNDNIHHQDWLEAGVRYSSTKITLPGDEPVEHADEFDDDDDDDDDDIRRAYAALDFSSIRERIAMSSLQGLPPLPRSLSGFNLSEGRREAGEPPPPPARSSSKTPKNVKSTQPSSSRPSPPGRQLTTLDTQLAILRKEMFGLRQLDLSLLSQLWSLNESIQEFRQLLQEQEDRAPSPSPSSEEGDDNSYGSHPPPPPRRPAPLLHHHRPPRPPRPLRPPASDDSPSSEEYGAV